jgi:DNA-binding transcriptional MerR regulator
MEERGKTMRIGDFARIGNVSLRTLRFYGEAGLLQPAHINPQNGYRHYDPQQLAQLHQIQLFKETGLSLPEIRELLARQLTARESREIFYQRRAALVKRMQDDAGRLAWLDARLRVLESKRSVASPTVRLRQTQPAWVISLREKIHRYEEAEEMFHEVERHVGVTRVSGQRAALWHSCANEGPAIDCEVLRFLKQPVSMRGAVRTFELPAATVASVVHFGGDQTIEDSYRALAAWLRSSEFRLCGPKREIYWVEAQRGAEAESLTEIQFPVMQAREAKRVKGFAPRK